MLDKLSVGELRFLKWTLEGLDYQDPKEERSAYRILEQISRERDRRRKSAAKRRSKK